MNKIELKNVLMAAQTLSPREQGIFDFILTEIRTARTREGGRVSDN